MSFQWIFDRMAQISIDARTVTAQTTSRSGVVRAASRTTTPFKITVNMPEGLPWVEARQYIAQAQALGMHTSDTVSIDQSGQDYIIGLSGGATTSMSCSATAGATSISITGGLPLASGSTYKLIPGDIIQLGSGGGIYQVVNEVISSATLNRPVIESYSGTILTGVDVEWEVICTNFPTWNMFQHGLVQFNGPFEFYVVDPE